MQARFSIASFLSGVLACVVLIVLVGLFAKASADSWLTVPLASYHFDRHRGYNEINLGVGVEQTLDDRWRVAGGVYRNSIRKDSYYAGAVYTPWLVFGVKLGTTMGVVTGYGRPLPIAAPVAVIEGHGYGLNIVLIPPMGGKNGGLALQVKRGF